MSEGEAGQARVMQAARAAAEPLRAGHDPLDVGALEHLVAQELRRELVELVAMLVDEPRRGALGLVGEVLLLLVAFTMVNISVLVLRRESVDHEHFRAPTIAPILAAIASVVLIVDNEAETFARAGLLLLLGVVLWIAAYAGGHRTGEHEVVKS